MTSPRVSPVDDAFTHEIIAGAIDVHRCLGPGLFESAYETCLAYELALRGLTVERQVLVPLSYKGVQLDAAYRIDLIVNRATIIEVKATERLHPVVSAQVLTYMKRSGIPVGLICNFHVGLLKDGIRRLSL